MQVPQAGWGFQKDAWKVADPYCSFVPLQRPLRIATFNVLFDSKNPMNPCADNPEVLQHHRRFRKTLKELERTDADIIGLNEVTQYFLGLLAEEAWVRKGYTLSTVPGEEMSGNTAVSKKFGNVLLSRIPLASLCHIQMPNGREAEAAIIHTRHRGLEVRTLVTSVHLIAFPTMIAQRASEIQGLTLKLEAGDDWDVAVVLGDFNFHREAESQSIPDGWIELPGALQKYTFDTVRNPMIRHYLPKIWWGAFCEVQMRLDRVIVAHKSCGPRVNLHASNVELFADVPVDEAGQHELVAPAGMAMGLLNFPFSMAQQLWNHRRQPWKEYLFPSDHFGLLVNLAMIDDS
jgi:endonuclease/exonuclease/phosphatase family metal-dependent hydrolase